jgi:hypothetical protein
VALAYGGNPAVEAAADYAIDGSLMAALPILRQFAANS